MRLKHFLSVFLTLLTLSVGQMWGDIAYGTYVLCTASTDLNATSHYIITSGTSSTVQCIKNENNDNNRKIVSATVSNGAISVASNSTIMTFTLGGSSNAWTFSCDNYRNAANTDYVSGYLTAGNTKSKNYLKVSTGGTNDTQKWTISVSTSSNTTTTTITANAGVSPYLKYNSNSSIFSGYQTNSQNPVYLFRKAVQGASNNTNYGTVSVAGDVITATPVSGYRVSTSNPYTISPTGKATVSQSGNVFTLTNVSAVVTLTVNFEAIPVSTPTLILTGSGAFGNVDVDATKDLNFTLTGSNLTANATVSVSGDGFSLVTPNTGTLMQTAGSITGSNNITVRFAPTAGGAHNGTLTVSSTGASNASVSLSGTGQLSDTFIDELHSTSGYTSASPHVEKGSYGTTPTITDKATATSGTCAQQHYHFVGWITSAKYTAGTAITADDLQNPTSATGATYYAVWAKQGSAGSSTTKSWSWSAPSSNLAYNTDTSDPQDGVDWAYGGYYSTSANPAQTGIQLNTCNNSRHPYFAIPAYNNQDISSISITSSSSTVTFYLVSNKPANSDSQTALASGTSSIDCSALSPAVKSGYLKVSGNVQVSGVSVTYGAATTYTDYKAVCCTELGQINGSFFWTTHFCPVWPAKHRS